MPQPCHRLQQLYRCIGLLACILCLGAGTAYDSQGQPLIVYVCIDGGKTNKWLFACSGLASRSTFNTSAKGPIVLRDLLQAPNQAGGLGHCFSVLQDRSGVSVNVAFEGGHSAENCDRASDAWRLCAHTAGEQPKGFSLFSTLRSLCLSHKLIVDHALQQSLSVFPVPSCTNFNPEEAANKLRELAQRYPEHNEYLLYPWGSLYSAAGSVETWPWSQETFKGSIAEPEQQGSSPATSPECSDSPDCCMCDSAQLSTSGRPTSVCKCKIGSLSTSNAAVQESPHDVAVKANDDIDEIWGALRGPLMPSVAHGHPVLWPNVDSVAQSQRRMFLVWMSAQRDSMWETQWIEKLLVGEHGNFNHVADVVQVDDDELQCDWGPNLSKSDAAVTTVVLVVSHNKERNRGGYAGIWACAHRLRSDFKKFASASSEGPRHLQLFSFHIGDELNEADLSWYDAFDGVLRNHMPPEPTLSCVVSVVMSGRQEQPTNLRCHGNDGNLTGPSGAGGKPIIVTLPLGYKAGFVGEGWASSKAWGRRSHVWLFVGGVEDRPQRKPFLEVFLTAGVRGGVVPIGGWEDHSMPVHDYRSLLQSAWFVPCPPGFHHVETFRVYETLEAGSIPIIPRDPYFLRLFGVQEFEALPFPCLDPSNVTSVDNIRRLLSEFGSLPLDNKRKLAETAHSWWQTYKFGLHEALVSHLGLLSEGSKAV